MRRRRPLLSCGAAASQLTALARPGDTLTRRAVWPARLVGRWDCHRASAGVRELLLTSAQPSHSRRREVLSLGTPRHLAAAAVLCASGWTPHVPTCMPGHEGRTVWCWSSRLSCVCCAGRDLSSLAASRRSHPLARPWPHHGCACERGTAQLAGQRGPALSVLPRCAHDELWPSPMCAPTVAGRASPLPRDEGCGAYAQLSYGRAGPHRGTTDADSSVWTLQVAVS